MKGPITFRLLLLGLLSVSLCGAGLAQTASGNVNTTLVTVSAIAIVFYNDPVGVPIGGYGTSAATMNIGNISAAGTLSSGITRSNVSGAGFTVSTPFDITVVGGVMGWSQFYTLTAQLAAAPPATINYKLDNAILSTNVMNVTTGGVYNKNTQHTLSIVVLSGFPAPGGAGTPISTTIKFVASAS